MKIFKLILLLSFLIASLSASERIMITKTSKKSNLKLINAKLKKINVKMYVKKIDSSYYIYSGSYKDEKSTNKVLRYIKKTFPSAYVISKKKETLKKKKDDSQKQDNADFFLSLALGSVSVDNSIDEGSIIIEPEASGISYALEGGYILNENIFFSLAYLSSSTSDLDINNIYISASYKINPMNDLGVYAGVLGGYSTLVYNEYGDDASSTSLLYGVQLGVNYDFYENIAVFTTYQGLLVNHVINDSDTTGIEFGLMHNIQLGILYRF